MWKPHCDWRSVSKSWCRVPSRDHDHIFTTVWQLRSCFWRASSLTRGRVCLLYMLLALASAVFLGSESLGTRNHTLLSQIWDFHFRRLLRLAGSRWRYSTPPPHGFELVNLIVFLSTCVQDNSLARTTSKTPFLYCCVRVRVCGNIFTEPFLRNGRLFFHLLHSNGCSRCLFRGVCLATDLCSTIYSPRLPKTNLVFVWHFSFFVMVCCTATCKRPYEALLTQKYWGFGLCLWSGILETRKHNVSETGCVCVLRCEGEDTYLVVSLRKG
jgi:hypothetical protein